MRNALQYLYSWWLYGLLLAVLFAFGAWGMQVMSFNSYSHQAQQIIMREGGLTAEASKQLADLSYNRFNGRFVTTMYVKNSRNDQGVSIARGPDTDPGAPYKYGTVIHYTIWSRVPLVWSKGNLIGRSYTIQSDRRVGKDTGASEAGAGGGGAGGAVGNYEVSATANYTLSETEAKQRWSPSGSKFVTREISGFIIGGPFTDVGVQNVRVPVAAYAYVDVNGGRACYELTWNVDSHNRLSVVAGDLVWANSVTTNAPLHMTSTMVEQYNAERFAAMTKL